MEWGNGEGKGVRGEGGEKRSNVHPIQSSTQTQNACANDQTPTCFYSWAGELQREAARTAETPRNRQKNVSKNQESEATSEVPERRRGRKAIQSEGSEEMEVCTGEWVVVERGGECERRTRREAGGGRREAGGRERGSGREFGCGNAPSELNGNPPLTLSGKITAAVTCARVTCKCACECAKRPDTSHGSKNFGSSSFRFSLKTS